MKKVYLSLFPLLTSLLLVGTAAAHVVLDYPLGGETFVVGDKINIQWHIAISHEQENWDLYFSPDGGANWQAIQLDLPSNQLNYQWVLPQVITQQARIRIYTDNTGVDYEDSSNDFTIQASTTSLESRGENPHIFALYANYPNPFNPITFIGYQISTASEVQLVIYNQLGQQVKSLVNERQAAGFYQVQWDSHNNKEELVSSGVYLYRLKAGSFIQMRKMVLLR